MRLRWALVLVVASACYRPALDEDCTLACNGVDGCPTGLACGTSGLCSTSNSCPGDTQSPDAPENCFGGGLLAPICTVDGDPVDLVLPSSIDTDDAAMCTVTIPQVGGVDLCVIRARGVITIDISSAFGARPLVLVAPQISVDNRLDVSRGGAGELAGGSCFNPSGMDGAQGSTLGVASGGGGSGGSFQGRGGFGGSARGMSSIGAGGASFAAMPFPTIVRGGCVGGIGSTGEVLNMPGDPGRGGGAVYFAAGMITVDGVINASGGAGLGTIDRGGGGGGGSGGLIVLDAPMIALMQSAHVIAAGGAGAAGAENNGTGANGGEPDFTTMNPNAVTAIGGPAPGAAGDGGNGSQFSNLDGAPGKDSDTDTNIGGGGGGGGAGFIRFFAVPVTNGAVVVPPPIVPQ